MPLFQSGALQNAASFAAPVAALVLTASFFLLAAVFIEAPWLRAGAASGAIGIPFFFSLPLISLLPFVAASVLLALFAARRMHKEYLLSLSFSTAKIAKAGLPLFFTAASILASWFYFQTMQMHDRHTATAVLIPRPVTDLLIRVLAQPLREATGLSEISADMTVDELLTASIRKELGKNGVSLTESGERGVTELLAHQRDAFARQYGITLDGSERLGEALHRAVIERLEQVLGPWVRFLPLVSALAFFFAFKTVTFPLYLVSVAGAALLIKALRTATIVKSERRQIEVERLAL
ncbi:MAG: hypothetical protein AAB533_03085 [Patescibacteria group bacterium]|mgnify:FL=1